MTTRRPSSAASSGEAAARDPSGARPQGLQPGEVQQLQARRAGRLGGVDLGLLAVGRADAGAVQVVDVTVLGMGLGQELAFDDHGGQPLERTGSRISTSRYWLYCGRGP